MADDNDDFLTPPGYTNQPEPSWVISRADQRLAFLIDQTGGDFTGYDLVQTPMTEPAPGQDHDEWDHQCDNCGVVTKELHGGHVFRKAPDGTRVIISFGSCPTCKDLP